MINTKHSAGTECTDLKMQLLLLCLLYWSWCVSAREIIISENGSDTPSCLEELNPLVSCQSLVDVSKYVTSKKLNNVTIRINDTNYTLQGVANFSGVENITITGKDRSLTNIYCNVSDTTGAGIAFDNSLYIAVSTADKTGELKYFLSVLLPVTSFDKGISNSISKGILIAR